MTSLYPFSRWGQASLPIFLPLHFIDFVIVLGIYIGVNTKKVFCIIRRYKYGNPVKIDEAKCKIPPLIKLHFNIFSQGKIGMLWIISVSTIKK